MAELILVKAANPERVALWERNADHPDGEVFVAGEGVVQVALTAMVQKKIDQGVLVRVDPETPAEETPTPNETPAPKTKKAK